MSSPAHQGLFLPLPRMDAIVISVRGFLLFIPLKAGTFLISLLGNSGYHLLVWLCDLCTSPTKHPSKLDLKMDPVASLFGFF